ncbi:uncharacterized protein LOC130716892 isoform X3 [Lotus japonicus]|nr:uncharacterized protein LOC130716892 isoform X3 [Lotus japonicus]
MKSNASASDMCKSDFPQILCSSAITLRSGRSSDYVMFPRSADTYHNLYNGALSRKQITTIQDGSNTPHKGFTGISQNNFHERVKPKATYMTATNIGGAHIDVESQHIPHFLHSPKRHGNLSIDHSPSQTPTSLLRDHACIKMNNAKEGLVGADAASSNFELRLGQPPQTVNTVPSLFNALASPSKLQPQEHMINSADLSREEKFQNNIAYAASSLKMVEEQPQFRATNYLSGVNNASATARARSQNVNVAKSLLFSPFPQFNHQPNGKTKTSEILVNDSGPIMHRKGHSECCNMQLSPTNVLCNSNGRAERESNNSAQVSNNYLANDKGVSFAKDCCAKINSEFGISQFMDLDSITRAVSGSDSYISSVNVRINESSLSPNTSANTNFFQGSKNKSSFGQDNHETSGTAIAFEGILNGLPNHFSSSTANQTPTFLQKQDINMNTCLLDENMRLLAKTQILELSQQQHALSFHHMNQKQGRSSNISKAQHYIYETSTSEQGTSGVSLTLPQNRGFCGNDDGFNKQASLVGLNKYCLSALGPIPLHSVQKESQCKCSCDLRHDEPSLSLGISKDNIRSCSCEKCSEQPSDTHLVDKCTCAARVNFSGRKFYLGIEPSHYILKQQFEIASGETSLKRASKCKRDQNASKGENIHFEQDGKLNGQCSIKIGTQTPQWRDVPSKVRKAACGALSSDQRDTVLDSKGKDSIQHGNFCANRFKRNIHKVDWLKEQENFNASSGYSAHVVSQASAEASKVDSCTVDVVDTGCGDNLIVDEGSGIDKGWSSDVAENEISSELLSLTSGGYLRNGYLRGSNDQTCHSPLDEHKVSDSLMWKKDRDQNHIVLSANCQANQSENVKKGLKGKKRKRNEKTMLDASLPSGISSLLDNNEDGESTVLFKTHSSLSKVTQMYFSCSHQRSSNKTSISQPSTKQRHAAFSSKFLSCNNHPSKNLSDKDSHDSESNIDARFQTLPEVSGINKLKKGFTSDCFGNSQMPDLSYTEHGNAKLRSFNSRKANAHRTTRPVVCGKYGEISSGHSAIEESKPAKIVPLSKVLNTSKRCMVPTNGKSRLTSKKNRKRWKFGTSSGHYCGQPGLKTEEDDETHNTTICNESNIDMSMEDLVRGSKPYVMYKGMKDDTKTTECDKIVNRADAQLKVKKKEIRKQRSINELTAKENYFPEKRPLTYDPIDEMDSRQEREFSCARTDGYKGRRLDGLQNNHYSALKAKGACLVPEEQLNAWIHINGQKLYSQGLPKFPDSDIEHDCRKEYARYKQAKCWKHLVVYKSGIHALGLYTSRFISRGEMVVEYVGEIVGLRVADKRESEYHSGRKLQYKSVCYFFKIDKEHIIDATRKGGVARFVNHSCLPNCIAKVITIRHEKKVVFFAERDIFPGEEITYDYHFNNEDEGKKIPCYCNSKNCRRYMN